MVDMLYYLLLPCYYHVMTILLHPDITYAITAPWVRRGAGRTPIGTFEVEHTGGFG